MRFYSLAVCGVLCALSSVSHCGKMYEELDSEVKSLDCPLGQQPAKVMQFSPNGLLTKAECIDQSLESSEETFESEELGSERAPNKVEMQVSEMPNTKCPFGSSSVIVWSSCRKGTKDPRDYATDVLEPTPPPKPVEVVDNEIMPKECPFAHRPVNVSPFCPSDAGVTSDCRPFKMMACVPEPFGNNPGSLRLLGREWEMGRSSKTEAELNFEMAHKPCIFRQRPMTIAPWCQTGANVPIDCRHTEVWCVQESFTGALKTVQELEKEILDMICPPNHDPTLIRSVCPIGSKRMTDCEEYRKACRPEPEEVRIGSPNSFPTLNRGSGFNIPNTEASPDEALKSVDGKL